jgi:hypothetical protein
MQLLLALENSPIILGLIYADFTYISVRDVLRIWTGDLYLGPFSTCDMSLLLEKIKQFWHHSYQNLERRTTFYSNY